MPIETDTRSITDFTPLRKSSFVCIHINGISAPCRHLVDSRKTRELFFIYFPPLFFYQFLSPPSQTPLSPSPPTFLFAETTGFSFLVMGNPLFKPTRIPDIFELLGLRRWRSSLVLRAYSIGDGGGGGGSGSDWRLNSLPSLSFRVRVLQHSHSCLLPCFNMSQGPALVSLCPLKAA